MDKCHDLKLKQQSLEQDVNPISGGNLTPCQAICCGVGIGIRADETVRNAVRNAIFILKTHSTRVVFYLNQILCGEFTFCAVVRNLVTCSILNFINTPLFKEHEVTFNLQSL